MNQIEKISPFAWKVLFILSVIAAVVLYTETMISIATRITGIQPLSRYGR